MTTKRRPKPYKRGKTYYFVYTDESGDRRYKSTGKIRLKGPNGAEAFVDAFFQELESGEVDTTLRDYSAPFFTTRCPHQKRIKRTFSPSYIRKSRSLLENRIWTDDISQMRIRDIRRGDIIDFLGRLHEEIGDKHNTIDKTLKVLKTIFSEAELREDIERNPTRRLTAEYSPKQRGAFSLEELQLLFKKRPGVWGDDLGYMVFYIAACTGMRSGEVRALSWEQIALEEGTININRAFKSQHEIGLPKWDKVREIPISSGVLSILKEVRDLSNDDGLLFRTSYGPLGPTWWKKRFDKALKASKIEPDGRELSPHSLRHTLNSILLQTGIDNWLVQHYLGWTSRSGLSPVQTGYTHLGVDNLRTVSRKIGQLF